MLTGLETLGLFEHLNVETGLLKDLVMMQFYTMGIIVYGIPEEERGKALEFASNFMMSSVEEWDKRMKKEKKNGTDEAERD